MLKRPILALTTLLAISAPALAGDRHSYDRGHRFHDSRRGSVDISIGFGSSGWHDSSYFGFRYSTFPRHRPVFVERPVWVERPIVVRRPVYCPPPVVVLPPRPVVIYERPAVYCPPPVHYRPAYPAHYDYGYTRYETHWYGR